MQVVAHAFEFLETSNEQQKLDWLEKIAHRGPSHIREIIIKMMIRISDLSSTPGFDHPERDEKRLRNGTAYSGFELGLTGLVAGPSACILWSAITLGPLAKGAPCEEVDDYIHMARDEVHAFSSLTAEMVGAWTIFAYVHGFLGDKEEFSRYLKRADALMSACKANGCKEPFPIISSYPSEAEVYRYMMAFNRAIVQVYARLSLSATGVSQRDGDGSGDFGTTELPQNERAADKQEESKIKMIPIPLDVAWGKFRDSSFKLDMLEKAVTQRC